MKGEEIGLCKVSLGLYSFWGPLMLRSNRSTVAQIAERVDADPRVCGSNPAKDPMVHVSIRISTCV